MTKDLKTIREEYFTALNSLYSDDEIQVIFLAITQQILKEDKIGILQFLNENQEVDSDKSKLFENQLDRLKNGEPLQYVQGFTNFYGFEMKVNSDVLIPRPETEELVEWILADTPSESSINIIDIGTGAGAIANVLSKNLSQSQLSAVDISEKALNVARKNAQKLGIGPHFIEDDFLNYQSSKYDEYYDLIVSNPPYIKIDEYVAENVYEFEPKNALYVPNENPLIFYQKIIDFAQEKLAPQGKIYVEINQFLSEETLELFQQYFQKVMLKNDISGNPRMIKAEKLKD